jgi:hypothetical protein
LFGADDGRIGAQGLRQFNTAGVGGIGLCDLCLYAVSRSETISDLVNSSASVPSVTCRAIASGLVAMVFPGSTTPATG